MNPIFPDEHGDQSHLEDSAHQVKTAENLPSRRQRRTSRKVRRRRRTVVMILVIAVFAVAGIVAFQALKPVLNFDPAKDYPGPGQGEVIYSLPEGATARTVASDLLGQDVVGSEGAFLDALSAANGAASLQPGSYPFKKQMKATDVVKVLLTPSQEKVHYAPIAQNLRQDEVFAALAKATKLPVTQFSELAKTPVALGLPSQAPSLEGYLAPGEYKFPTDATAQQILTKMIQTTKDELTATGITDPADQFRVLTIASIIEAEGNEQNYPMISGAIENRLKNLGAETGGRLESDATVAYGLGVKTYNITSAQKVDTSNPYNTFAKAGLPVGPIGSPKVKAIEAAAHPQSNPYYFWVTVNLDTGETLYAATLAEHNVNVAKYQAWCQANEGKCS